MSDTDDFEARVIQLAVGPAGAAIYDERVTLVEITDESGGEFVLVRQDDKEIKIDPAEWPMLRDAIAYMVKRCRL